MPLQELVRQYRAGHHLTAQREWQRLMVELPGDDRKVMAELHYYGAMIHWHLKGYYAAAKLIELASHMAAEAADLGLIGRIRYQAGAVLRMIGETGQAVDSLEQFLLSIQNTPHLRDQRTTSSA